MRRHDFTLILFGLAACIVVLSSCAMVEVHIDSNEPCASAENAVTFGGTTDCEDSEDKSVQETTTEVD